MHEFLEGLWTTIHVYLIGLIYAIREKFWKRPQLNDIWRRKEGASRPVALVTGGTTGIGLQTTVLLLEQGFRVIVVARDTSHASFDDWTSLLRQCENVDLDLRIVDLTSLKNVRKLTDELLSELDRLHVLVCNAGVMLHPFALTTDGFETHFAVHLLAHALLIDRLKPLLQRAHRLDGLGRVVNVSSSTLFAGNIRLKPFGQNYINGYSAYADSKLAVAVYTHVLQKHCDSMEVVCLHPGVIPGHLYRFTAFPFKQLICGVTGRVWLRSTIDAAFDVLNLCLTSRICAGCYYEHGSIVPLPAITERDADELFERVQNAISSVS